MGLMDVLNGMANGPRGEKEPGQGGMSPITMGILALLGWKAFEKFREHSQSASPAGTALPPGGTAGANQGSGGLLGGAGAGGLGGLGGLLAGAGAGGLLSGGLSDIVEKLRNAGHGDAADSWVGGGANKSVSPSALESVFGDRIDGLAKQLGIPREELLQGLSQHLPDVVNHLTPDGRLPNEQEMSRHL